MTKKNVLENILLVFQEEKLIKADGFDEAVIGIDTQSYKLIYSVSKCIDILKKDMTLEQAQEYFEYNIYGAYVGEKTPIWCWDNIF